MSLFYHTSSITPADFLAENRLLKPRMGTAQGQVSQGLDALFLLGVTGIFARNRDIYKPVPFCPQVHVSKDFRGNVQNGTNTLRPLDDSPW